MKIIRTTSYVTFPEDVKFTVKGRVVTVTGPLGKLTRNFKHVSMDIQRVKAKTGAFQIKIELWFGKKRNVSCVKTIATHIKNMITGVTKGYRYYMKFVYAHFPINCVMKNHGRIIEIRNFLGEKYVRRVAMLAGVRVRSSKEKDEIYIEGIDLENVAQSAALIHQIALVKRKDIRKFLDGIYVNKKTFMINDED